MSPRLTTTEAFRNLTSCQRLRDGNLPCGSFVTWRPYQGAGARFLSDLGRLGTRYGPSSGSRPSCHAGKLISRSPWFVRYGAALAAAGAGLLVREGLTALAAKASRLTSPSTPP